MQKSANRYFFGYCSPGPRSVGPATTGKLSFSLILKSFCRIYAGYFVA